MNTIKTDKENNDPKLAFLNVLEGLLLDISKDEYLVLTNNRGDFLAVLKGDGKIAGNYYLQSITHINDIMNSNIKEDYFPLDDMDIDAKKLNAKNVNIDDVFEDDAYFKLGKNHGIIKKMVENDKMSFDVVFDLMVGEKKEGRYLFDVRTIEEIETRKVELSKDIDIDVLVGDESGFRWEKRSLGKAGDKILAMKNYALYDNDGVVGSFYLSPGEIKNDMRLKNVVQEKRNSMINKTQAPKSSI